MKRFAMVILSSTLLGSGYVRAQLAQAAPVAKAVIAKPAQPLKATAASKPAGKPGTSVAPKPAVKLTGKTLAKPVSKTTAQRAVLPILPKVPLKTPAQQIQELEAGIETLYKKRAMEACQKECVPICKNEGLPEPYCKKFCASTQGACKTLCLGSGGKPDECAAACTKTCPVLTDTDPQWGWPQFKKSVQDTRKTKGSEFAHDNKYIELLKVIQAKLQGDSPSRKKSLDKFNARIQKAHIAKGKEETDDIEIEQALLHARTKLTPAQKKAAMEAEKKEQIEEVK